MKKEDDYINVIHGMGYEPFFILYHSAEQVSIYRSYCCTTKYPKLVIDATGSLIKSFKKLGLDKTKSLLLYEALVYDADKKQNFTVTNMISESHSNIDISNWLLKWLRCDVPKPKHTVCDQSLALLSAIVQSFTQYSSLRDYLNVCAELLKGNIKSDSFWLPRCYIRIDVAHFIKIASKWVPLKKIARLAKEMVLRTIGLLIKCQTLVEMRLLILSLFVLFTNETNGTDIENGEETPCEKYKNIITEATSTGFVDFQKQFEDILSTAETEDEARTLLEMEYDRQNEGLNIIDNPFQAWCDGIFNESKTLIREGAGINPFYCPELVRVIIKSIKLMPLWSGVMIPIFRYGEDVSSSAAVESSFKKLKHITFKHILLPTEAEIFLENHIQSLKGSSLIRSAKNGISTLSPIYEASSDVDKIIENSIINDEEKLSNERDWSDSDELIVDDNLIRELNINTNNISEENQQFINNKSPLKTANTGKYYKCILYILLYPPPHRSCLVRLLPRIFRKTNMKGYLNKFKTIGHTYFIICSL